MQIAKLTGYTLGGADLLRRAMGEKPGGDGEIFLAGPRPRGSTDVPPPFRLMEKFMSWQQIHSAAYALGSYQTA